MKWYYSKGGVQFGPVPEADLRAKLVTGEVEMGDLVWREGMKDWLPVGHVEEFVTLPNAAATLPKLEGGEDSPYAPPVSQVAPLAAGEFVPNYLWQSIVVTIFCCWPFGIPAIVYSAKVDGLRAGGDLQGARSASEKAKMWCWVAVGAWAVLIVFWWLFAGFSGFYPSY